MHLMRNLLAVLALSLSACSGGSSTLPADAGAKAQSDAGSTVQSDAGSTVQSDAGSTVQSDAGSTVQSDAGSTVQSDAGSCASGTACGTSCCSATETCSGGTCVALPSGCDPVAQTGCQVGQGCYWDWSEEANVCKTAGTGATGASCAADLDCTPGGTCAPGDKCTPYCDPEAANTCTGGKTCLPYGDGTGFCATECDVLAQGCAGTEACYPIYEGTRGTCLAAGTVAVGAECEADADCVKGAMCLEEQGAYVCLKACSPEASPDPCTAPQVCGQLTSGSGEALEGLGACGEPTCNPVEQDCADTSKACVYDWDLETYVCRAPGTKTYGQQCSEDTDCLKGMTCFGGTDGDECTWYCDPEQTSGGPCTGSDTCVDAGDGYGFCTAE